MNELIIGFIGSSLSCIGNIIITNAIVKGLGGPASALA